MTIDSLLAVQCELKDKGIQHLIQEKQEEIEEALANEDFQRARLACLKMIYLFSHNFPEQMPQRKPILTDLTDLFYSINGRFIPLSELTLGTFVNARISGMNKETQKGGKVQERNGTFAILDEHGTEHACYVKDFPDVERGVNARLWITNLRDNGYTIYLEPRLEAGDRISVKIKPQQKIDPCFRFLNYDGFIKIKEGGIQNVQANHYYQAEIIYHRRDVVIDEAGEIKRVGIAFAKARKSIDEETYNQKGTRIAKARQTKVIFYG